VYNTGDSAGDTGYNLGNNGGDNTRDTAQNTRNSAGKAAQTIDKTAQIRQELALVGRSSAQSAIRVSSKGADDLKEAGHRGQRYV
jgi:hypothetical protein